MNHNCFAFQSTDGATIGSWQSPRRTSVAVDAAVCWNWPTIHVNWQSLCLKGFPSTARNDWSFSPRMSAQLPPLTQVNRKIYAPQDLWQPVKFSDTGAKILSEVPAPWYSAVQTKVPCVESAVRVFLKSSHQTLKSISKRRKYEHQPQCPQIIDVKCSNYQAAQKCDHWQIKSKSPAHPWRS